MRRCVFFLWGACTGALLLFGACPPPALAVPMAQAFEQGKVKEAVEAGLAKLREKATARRQIEARPLPATLAGRFPTVTRTDQVENIWAQAGAGRRWRIIRAVVPAEDRGVRLARLGDAFSCLEGENTVKSLPLVVDDPAFFQRPASYELVAQIPTGHLTPEGLAGKLKSLRENKDPGTGGETLYFWKPVAPAGFQAVGCVTTLSKTPPAADLVRCVRQEFLSVDTFAEPVFPAGFDQPGFWFASPALGKVPRKFEDFTKNMAATRKQADDRRAAFLTAWTKDRQGKAEAADKETLTKAAAAQATLNKLFSGAALSVDDHKRALETVWHVPTATFWIGNAEGMPPENVYRLVMPEPMKRAARPRDAAEFWKQGPAPRLVGGKIQFAWSPDQLAAMEDILEAETPGKTFTAAEIAAAFDSPTGKKWMADPAWRANLLARRQAADRERLIKEALAETLGQPKVTPALVAKATQALAAQADEEAFSAALAAFANQEKLAELTATPTTLLADLAKKAADEAKLAAALQQKRLEARKALAQRLQERSGKRARAKEERRKRRQNKLAKAQGATARFNEAVRKAGGGK